MSGWTRGEIATIVAAARRAPLVCCGEPWVLEFHDHHAALFERFDRPGGCRDPQGGNRLLSCGAALTNVRLAVRALGWATVTVWFPNPLRPDEVVRVIATRRSAPTGSELAGYRVIRQRRDFRGRFGWEPVPGPVLLALARASDLPGVRVEAVPCGEAESAERSLIVATAGDGRRDHLLAGAAVEEIWLAAARAGLAGVLSTDRDERRAGLPGPAGFPQALLRVGVPARGSRSVARQGVSDVPASGAGARVWRGAGQVAEDLVE